MYNVLCTVRHIQFTLVRAPALAFQADVAPLRTTPRQRQPSQVFHTSFHPHPITLPQAHINGISSNQSLFHYCLDSQGDNVFFVDFLSLVFRFRKRVRHSFTAEHAGLHLFYCTSHPMSPAPTTLPAVNSSVFAWKTDAS